MEADVVEAEAVEKPSPPKKSNAWIWIVACLALGVCVGLPIIIVGLMIGPRLLESQKKAHINMAKVQIGSFRNALELYCLDMRSYPSSEDGLQSLLEQPSDEKAARKWDGPYLDADVLPVDPWDNEFVYEYPPSNNASDFPDIWSFGPDGEAGTDDDIIGEVRDDDF